MSLKVNILVNLISQVYVCLIGIIILPSYLHYMGAETYGLVGFFGVLQGWFQLLDIGLTPTMARETARFNGGASNSYRLRSLLRYFEGIFIGISLLVGGSIIIGASEIAKNWLKVQHLEIKDVQHSIMLMAIIVALRWVCGLYRSVINGFERFVWLSGFNITIATARYVMVIPFFIYFGSSPTQFFTYQLVLTVIEIVVLTFKTYSFLPPNFSDNNTNGESAHLGSVFKFSVGIAFSGTVWVLVTQIDKLLMSKILPLSNYAYFTMAVLVAGGVSFISGPISGALLPRLSKVAAQGQDDGVIHLYRNATQLVGIIAIPAALILAFFSEQVLFAWTGDSVVAREAAPILTLYALGNGILALNAFPYYLQYAKGDLYLHMIGNAFFLVALVPALIWATLRFGMTGAGFAWLGANVVYFCLWIPKVHHRFAKGLHSKWLIVDVGSIFLITLLGAVLIKRLIVWPCERLHIAELIMFVSMCLVIIASLSSSLVRNIIKVKYSTRFALK